MRKPRCWWPTALVVLYGLLLAVTAGAGSPSKPVPSPPRANLFDKPGCNYTTGEIVVIVIGLAIIGKRSSVAPGPLPRRVSGLILAVLSAISFGLQPVVMKLGLQESAEPLSASVIGTAAALLGFLLYLLFSGRLRSLQFDRRSLGFFGFVGVAHTLGFLTINFAVNADDVTLVYPISATAPLFTFVMSYFLLKNVERLTLWDLVGMLAIMAGVVVLFK